MDSYIVRLYRRDSENSENLVGLVETVGEDQKRPFHTVSELVAILSEPHPGERVMGHPILKVIDTRNKSRV